jgi:transposase
MVIAAQLATRTAQGGQPASIVLGVDTHADQHVAAALDEQGRLLGTHAVPTTPAGYRALLAWASTQGSIARVGIEGTGSYGAGLARWLRRRDVEVVEVDRPNRRLRHHRGKSDTVDAEAAARAAQARTATGQPKSGDGHVEAIRVLRTARRSAVKARTQAMNQLHALVVTAPEEVRTQLRPLSPTALVTVVARFRPPSSPATPVAATKAALRGIAQRYQALTRELAQLDQQLAPLIAAAAPTLVAIKGVGTDIAGTLLVAVGDNPDRLHSEAAFACILRRS